MKKNLILILGVHRSGTSLLTHGLSALGVSSGDFIDTCDTDNPDGYGELPEVRDFSDRLLGHLGASWDNWGFRAGVINWDDPALAPWYTEAVAILQLAFPGKGPFVLKDPRVATLAPFWETVVPAAGFELRRILILRDPAEVAESQRQRVDRRPHLTSVIAEPEPMAALWAVTMHEVLLALRDDRTLLITHADLLADPGLTLSRAVAFAGGEVDPEALERFCREGVKSALYRSRVDRVVGGAWMGVARSLFDALSALGSGHVLGSADAQRIARAQRKLRAFLPGLEAARLSIARMTSSRDIGEAPIEPLQRLVWILSPLVANASKANLNNAVEQVRGLERDLDVSRTSFAFCHAVVRLYLLAERPDEALLWLDRLRPSYGHYDAFTKLEETVELARKTQSTVAKDQ